MTLHTKITKALTGTTPKHPVMLDKLRKIAAPLVDDMQQLYDLLDRLHASSVVQRMAGFVDNKQYIAYWEIPDMGRVQNTFLPSHISALPASALKAQPVAAKPAAAKPAKTEYITVPRKAKPGSITTTLLQHITSKPGQNRAELITWAEANITGATRSKANGAIGNLCTRKLVEAVGKRYALKYYAQGAAPKDEPTPTPAARAQAKPRRSTTH